MRLPLISCKFSMNSHLLSCCFILFVATSACSASERLVIVAFGDSTTAPRKAVQVFAKQLEQQFVKEKHPVHVINAGNTSRQAR
jgi:hypothetical protein